MLGHLDMIAIVVVVLALVFAGVHIAIALGVTAALGIYLMCWRLRGGAYVCRQYRL